MTALQSKVATHLRGSFLLVGVYTQDVGDQWYLEGQEGLVDFNDGFSQLSDILFAIPHGNAIIGEQ